MSQAAISPPVPTTEYIQTILDSLEGSTSLYAVTRPRNGLTSSVFCLETDSEALILRTFDEAAASWKPKKEQIVCDLLRKQGIPAPIILKTDVSHTLVPFAYAVSERLPGVTLSEIYDSLDTDQKLFLYHQLGGLLGRIHSLTFDAFGDVDASKRRIAAGPAWEIRADDSAADPGPFATWQTMHRQIVAARLYFLDQTEFRDLVPPIRQWFERRKELLQYPITPRLLHMDLHRSNLLVSDGQITGVLDVGEVIIGHNEYDLMRTELAHFGAGYEEMQEAFYEGYGQHQTLDNGFEQRKPFYELSRWLVGLKCLAQYGCRCGGDPERQAARHRIAQLLSRCA